MDQTDDPLNREGRVPRWDDHRRQTFIYLLALTAVPLALALVGVVLYVALPTIDSVKSLNIAMVRIIEHQENSEKLNEQRYQAAQQQERYYAQQLSALLDSSIAKTERITALTARVDQHDKRLDKIEDARAGFYRGK